YYLVNSSFAYFPGIPIFHSTDLVNWRQIGNVVSRPDQLNYRGLGVSRGIFAPALSHHGGTFYLLCTFVDAGGNFLMTASDPAGPWSNPVWLGFDGIDASLFFDEDGRAWIVNNGEPPNGKAPYQGHRAIWLQEFDAVSEKMIGPRTVIVDGGADMAKQPVWIEGPHLFKKDGWYYLICAEGGTAENHSEIAFRSRSVLGPFLPGPRNPILTQRTLPEGRPNPVTCTGHAELVQAVDGEWWSVFLGCRPYEDGFFNTGRETFLLHASWREGWPTILGAGDAVPLVAPSPPGASMPGEGGVPLSGNFTWRDDFSGPSLSPLWLMLRTPDSPWWRIGEAGGHLLLTPRLDSLAGTGNPSFLGRRLQHARFEATVRVAIPEEVGVKAGEALFQNENHNFFLCVTRRVDGAFARIELNGRGEGALEGRIDPHAGFADLRFEVRDGTLRAAYSTDAGAWTTLGGDIDSRVLSTKAAGGFVGSTVGPYAALDNH
ncbi:MAG TPA: glycoside hydrolase family 43 protein, partial [Opitutaceae bacterium]